MSIEQSEIGPKHDIDRRGFLVLCRKVTRMLAVLFGGFGAMAVAKTAPKAAAVPAIDGYKWTDHKWGFGIDVNRCIGCLRCVDACQAENGVPDPNYRTWVERYVYLEGELKPHIDSQSDAENQAASGEHHRFDNRYKDAQVDKAFFVPKLCNQCEHPACVQVCPVAATYKTEDGVVLIDETRCIGCGYCVQACPYGARYLNPERGHTDKCTWCYHRITKGLNPACVEVCPTQARIFGDMKDPGSPIRTFIRDNRIQVLKPEMGNAPQVFYAGLDTGVK